MASLLPVTKESIEPKNLAANRSGYVCPFCRIIFSLPHELGGNGASCPGCEHLLTIPTRDDGVSAICDSSSKYKKAIVQQEHREMVRHHKILAEGEHHEWADAQDEHSGKGLKLVISIALMSLLLIGGLGYWFLFGSADLTKPIVATDIMDDDRSETKIEPEDEVEKGEGIYVYNSKNKEQVEQLKEFLTGMYAAKTVDELLLYVRPSENIKEKMVKFYKGNTLNQSPFKEIDLAVNTPDLPHFLSFRCQTQDYNNHFGFLKYSREEILLDWESYVAFSDMGWSELAENKPTDAVRVRVTAKRAFYYNDEFTDERKWQSVSLVSPNEADAIYGYVEKGSATEHLLFNFGNSDNRKVVLDVYFPENAKKGNQVFIGSVVTNGWIIKDKE